MYTTFAMQQQVGGRGNPFLQYWILEDDKCWHDVVRGDGGSYSGGGPNDIEAMPGETVNAFAKRVKGIVDKWGNETMTLSEMIEQYQVEPEYSPFRRWLEKVRFYHGEEEANNISIDVLKQKYVEGWHPRRIEELLN